MATPVMGTVPVAPTMTLSSILTNWVMPFWIMMGRARAMIRL